MWTGALQAPLSMGFPRQVYWSGLPFPSPGYLPDPGIETTSPVLTGGFFTSEPPRQPVELNTFSLFTRLGNHHHSQKEILYLLSAHFSPAPEA